MTKILGNYKCIDLRRDGIHYDPKFLATQNFLSDINQGGPGSVRFGYGLRTGRLERLRFWVGRFLWRNWFLCVSLQF